MSNAQAGLPIIIQGGLGVAVSDWRLAQAVSSQGQLGVVSGTALDQVLTRRLQDGDPGGHMKRAMDAFPEPAIVKQVWEKYYVEGGKADDKPYKMPPMQSKEGPKELSALHILANFVEVWLARQGHSNPVGINFMEKLQCPHLASIYGAMLGGVGFVLMGAGIPMKIPGILDKYVNHEEATYPLTVTGAKEGDDTLMRFNPKEFLAQELPPLHRPMFLPIIASNVLAVTLARKANGRVDGFIIEGPTAGGHNAPPRGALQLNELGEPIYGERDRVDLKKMRELGLPFWLAGGYGTAEQVQDALAEGAAGVQVGTAFAMSNESGMCASVKADVLAQVVAGTLRVKTDPLASPTGFPFKVAQVKGSVAEQEVFEARKRVCDLGYLREAYRTDEGKVAFRCPAEPEKVYAAKGGTDVTDGRKCICNGLLSAIAMPQVRGGEYLEPPVVTAGDDLVGVHRFLKPGQTSYTVADVLEVLLPKQS